MEEALFLTKFASKVCRCARQYNGRAVRLKGREKETKKPYFGAEESRLPTTASFVFFRAPSFSRHRLRGVRGFDRESSVMSLSQLSSLDARLPENGIGNDLFLSARMHAPPRARARALPCSFALLPPAFGVIVFVCVYLPCVRVFCR